MPEAQVEAFYDGDCPLCLREVRLLRRLDRGRDRILFTNIADPSFDPDSLGMEWSAFMRRMHGRLPDGSWVEGVEVFRRMYAAVGFGPLVWLSRAPGVKQLLDWLYDRFAENRLRLTGRCTASGSCSHSSHVAG
jgi:predicted DCC family thiol-disulfide oxidoreductase YuxK